MAHGGAYSGLFKRAAIAAPWEPPITRDTAEPPWMGAESAEWMAYWVLVLGEGGSRLYKGLRESLTPVVGHSFPIRRAARIDQAVPWSDAVEESRCDAAYFAFMQSVDRRLHTFLDAEPRPLVLAGSNRSLASFCCLTRQRELIIGCLLGDFVSTPSSALARLVWPLVLSARVRGNARLRSEPRAPQCARWLVHTPPRRGRPSTLRATLDGIGDRGTDEQPGEALDARSGQSSHRRER